MRKFLWTTGIAVGVFGICLGVAFSGLLDADTSFNYYTAGVIYYTAFYLAPLAFLVGIIGSLVCFIRSQLTKARHS
jgi:hypothetical protein